MTAREDVYTGKTIAEVLAETTEYAGTTPSIVGRSAYEKFKSFALEATSNSTLSPVVYKELLRAMLVSFGNISYVDGENKLQRVKSIHAAPERTIAKYFQENNIILPVITIQQDSVKDDINKRRYDNILIQRSVWNDDIQRAERVISVADVPVTIQYSMNLWCKYMEDIDQISQSIRGRFNPGVLLKTSISNSIKAFLMSESNKEGASAPDREDRLLRKSFLVEIETYIPSPQFKVTSTGRIEKVVSELWVS